MDYIELSISTTSEGVQPLIDRLTALGAESLSIEDERDFEDFLENNRKYWYYVDEGLRQSRRGLSRVIVYLENTPDSAAFVDALQGELARLRADLPEIDFGGFDIAMNTRQEDDWQNSWKAYYRPFEVGSRLLVCPEWEAPPKTDRVIFKNNPGMAFGSGEHASTRMCLDALEKVVRGGEKVLDMGCGSGILSIVSVLLGAQSALGVDVDPAAAEVSANNAALNGVSDRCSFVCADLLDRSGGLKLASDGYDIILGNIVADVIIALLPRAKTLLAPGGVFICSGIIDTRLPDTLDALAKNGFAVRFTEKKDGWCAVAAGFSGL